MNTLIIWDFDGVIADSEKLWVSVGLETGQEEKNISLSEEEKLNLLVGIADKGNITGISRWCIIEIKINNKQGVVIRRTGGDRLSRVLRQSTIGEKRFNDRVRNGIGWDTLSMTTNSSDYYEL